MKIIHEVEVDAEYEGIQKDSAISRCVCEGNTRKPTLLAVCYNFLRSVSSIRVLASGSRWMSEETIEILGGINLMFEL